MIVNVAKGHSNPKRYTGAHKEVNKHQKSSKNILSLFAISQEGD